MRIKELKEALPGLVELGVTPMLVGHHGLGKTSAVKQFAEENGHHLVILNLGTQETGDLIGLPEINVVDGQKETDYATPEWLAKTVKFAKQNPKKMAIIFLDEITRARKEVIQSIFPLVLEKRMHRVYLPNNVFIIAATNPSTDDYVVLDFTDRAYIDRFCFIKFAPGFDEWLDYAEKNEFDKDLLSFIRISPNFLDGDAKEFSIQDLYPISPSRRAVEVANNIIKSNIKDKTKEELLSGVLGTSATIAFLKYVKDNTKKPLTAKQIMNEFSKFQSKIDHVHLDIISASGENLLKEWEKLKSLKDEQINNVIDFLLTVPKDYSVGLYKRLLEANITMTLETVKNKKDLWNRYFSMSKEFMTSNKKIKE